MVLFAIVFYVIINCFGDNLDGNTAFTDLIDGCFLILKRFVNRKEMSHLVKNVLWKLVNIGVNIIVRVIERNCDRSEERRVGKRV